MPSSTGRAGQKHVASVSAPPRRILWRALGLGALVAGVGLASYFLIVQPAGIPEFSGKAIADYILSLGVWGYAVVIGLMILHCFVPFPAEVVAVAAGMCYGIFFGTVLTWTGAMCGAALSFWLARQFGRPFVEMIVSDRHYPKLERIADRQGTNALLLSRFVPIIAFNLINYAAGLTRVSWPTFLWTSAVGILPLTILMVAMGHQMRDPNWRDWLLLAAAGMLLLLAVIAIDRRFKSNKRHEKSQRRE